MAMKGYPALPKAPALLETSQSDSLVSYSRLSLGESYLSAQKQSVYSTAPADWARVRADLRVVIIKEYSAFPKAPELDPHHQMQFVSYPGHAVGAGVSFIGVSFYSPSRLGASCCVMVNKLDLQTCKNEFESHRVPHSYGLVPHLSKRLSKLLLQPRHLGKT